MSMITQALAEFDEPKAAIAIVRQYANLTLIADGIGKVEEAHKQVKRLRLDITSRGKSLRDGANAYNKAIIAEEKRLIAEVEPIEAALWGQRQIHEAEKEKEKQAKEAAKKARLQARINQLAEKGCVAGDIAAIDVMDDDEFGLHLMREAAKAERIREETEAARIEAERREVARFEEIKRQADELRLQQEKIAAERQRMETERESIRIQQAELDRQHEAIQFSERQRVLAERKAEDDRLAQIAAEQAEAARVARLEALRPEIEKAETFGNRLMVHAVEILRVMDQPSWSVDALESVRRCGLEVLMIARGEA